jgi:hypothetical protein
MLQNASKSVCTWPIVSCDPLSPSYCLNFFSSEDSENRGGPGDPELADVRDVQMDYSSDKLYNPSIGIVTKNYL